MPPATDEQFVETAVRMGLVHRQQAQHCLNLYHQYLQAGKNIRLAQLFAHYKLLDATQISSVYRALAATTAVASNNSNKNQPPLTATTVFAFSGELAANLAGRYQFIEEIGRGAMGIVYKVYDSRLERTIALKAMQSNPIESPKQGKRFLRETRLLAKLNHPGIIKIYDIATAHNYNFFTMELIDGESLEQLMADGSSSTDFVRILLKVAQAVHYAHQNGVIHRDLKPSNILIDQENQPRVADFGLAKEISSQNKDKLSQSLEIIGTLQYMAPEQAAGNSSEIDAQSDIYALGAILYHFLAGRAAFSGDTVFNILHQIACEEPIVPSKYSPGVSRDLEAICLKAMEKEKTARYGDAGQMAQDLENYLQGRDISAKPVTLFSRSWKLVRRHRILATMAVITALIFVAMICFFIYKLKNEKDNALRNEQQAKRNEQQAKLNTHKANFKTDLATLKKWGSDLSVVEVKLQKGWMHLVMAKSDSKINNYYQAQQNCKKIAAINEKCRNELLNFEQQLRQFTIQDPDISISNKQEIQSNIQSLQHRLAAIQRDQQQLQKIMQQFVIINQALSG